jgi:hypothetical protein
LRHAVKIGLLAAGLGVLAWWGWSGNFVFRQGALFGMPQGEGWYSVSIAGKPMGYSHRVVGPEAQDGSFSVRESSVATIPIPGFPLSVRLESEASYDSSGRLKGAAFTVPSLPGAKASIVADPRGGKLSSSVSALGRLWEKEVPLPKEGPVLVSGVVPWLSRQREIPLGKVMLVSLLELPQAELRQAELTVTDDTTESEEVQVYRITVRTDSWEASEWVDAKGRLLRQSLSGIEAGLTLLEGEASVGLAKEALARPVREVPLDKIPKGVMDLLGRYLPGAQGKADD